MDDQIDAFVQALAAEVRSLQRDQALLPIKTIFFGGGTPSMLSPAHYRALFDAINTSFAVMPDAEITLEANPNDLSLDYLHGLRAAGFNRLSIGMQSSKAEELALFERQHDMQMVVDAVKHARAAGFDDISLDLIFGNPHQTLMDWDHTLAQALALNPQHISLYNLELKGGTQLTQWVDAGVQPQPDDDLAADMYELATERLNAAGLRQYEISNWGLPGCESQHNLQYWRNLPYLGLGPGAHGFAGGLRYTVTSFPARYIEAMRQSTADSLEFPRTPATAKAIPVDRETEMADTIMMGLRMTREGIQRAAFRQRFGHDLVMMQPEAIEKHIGYGLLHVDETVVRLTDEGRFLSNAVIRDLI
jgi:oxygen-independent coproporphyrinogen III oxidase